MKILTTIRIEYGLFINMKRHKKKNVFIQTKNFVLDCQNNEIIIVCASLVG
jgi:hypothetical protein